MPRDMNLVRELLFAMQHRDRVPAYAKSLVIEGYKDSEIQAHLLMLSDTELVAAEYHSRTGILQYYRLTYQGHDFVEELRKQTPAHQATQKTKDTVLYIIKLAVEQGIQIAMAELRRQAGWP